MIKEKNSSVGGPPTSQGQHQLACMMLPAAYHTAAHSHTIKAECWGRLATHQGQHRHTGSISHHGQPCSLLQVRAQQSSQLRTTALPGQSRCWAPEQQSNSGQQHSWLQPIKRWSTATSTYCRHVHNRTTAVQTIVPLLQENGLLFNNSYCIEPTVMTVATVAVWQTSINCPQRRVAGTR